MQNICNSVGRKTLESIRREGAELLGSWIPRQALTLPSTSLLLRWLCLVTESHATYAVMNRLTSLSTARAAEEI